MVSLRREIFRKVTIVGIGLIGGSLGLAIKKNRLAREVVGLSQRHSTLVAAMKMQAVDQVYQDVKKAVQNADCVILATPVSIITGMLVMIGPHLRRNCIVTDVGSTKVSIVKAAEDNLPKGVNFVGSHPLAGSEKKGVQNATPDLLTGRLCIMTPEDKTPKAVSERIKRLWTRIGSRVKYMTPQEHDRVLAYISHMPHLLAYALVDTIPDKYLEYATKGLKDTTRIASSTPQIWNDICMGNAKNIVTSLDEIVGRLSLLRKAIMTHDQKGLLHLLKNAKTKRDKIA